MWLLSTFAIKMLEADLPVSGNKFIYYQNCFWFIGISLTTIGYGDIYPVSSLGQFFVCFCCIWSTFNNSVVTFLIVSNLSLKKNEHKSLQMMKKIDESLKQKKICGQYIKTVIWRLWLNKKYDLNLKESMEEKKLKFKLQIIRKIKKKSLN
jgi:hypothetical protein